MKINCAIIDDEPLARKGLKEYIGEVDFLSLTGEFDSPLKAAEVFYMHDVQLMFLDIQMPKLSGLDFLKMIKSPPPVIFTTAYPQFALDGYELNALDYLVKPIAFDRFLKAALKAKEYYEVRQSNTTKQPEATLSKYFYIKVDAKLVKIFFDDILFVEALQNYVTIHTATKNYITYLTFKSVEEYLQPDTFIKTHKSYIVSKSKVDSIEGNLIRIGNENIPISRNLKEEVLEKLLGDTFLKR